MKYEELASKEEPWDRYYHGCARTTAAVRRTIQNSQESLSRLAERYDTNPKTVAKWKKRTNGGDAPMGPRPIHSTILTPEQESIWISFRRMTLLSLDDCLYALQSTIPSLTRSSLHRCFQRHEISRLPETEGDKPPKKKLATYPRGYFHIDSAEVRTEEGKLYLCVAIDRTSKFTYAEWLEKYTKMEAAPFLRNLMAAVPYHIHTILTESGIHFTHHRKDQWAFTHIFDRVCPEYPIEHRLTKVNHP